MISYVIQRGRCRFCGSAISFQYPLVELASGAIFLLLWNTKVEPMVWIVWITSAAFFWLLLVLAVYDTRHQILPDVLVVGSVIAAFVMQLWKSNLHNFIFALATGAAFFLFFGALWFFSRGRWMGLGDAKLAFAIGIFLGWPVALAALFLSFWIGAVLGLGWAAAQGVIKKRRLNASALKIPIPFGPFLALGAFIAYLWGDALIEWYLRLVI